MNARARQVVILTPLDEKIAEQLAATDASIDRLTIAAIRRHLMAIEQNADQVVALLAEVPSLKINPEQARAIAPLAARIWYELQLAEARL